jgi:hypothetical protein
MLLKELCGDVLQERAIVDPVDRRIPVRQARFPGGVQLWGSNPAIIWTSPKLEEGGIHFHGFNRRTLQPTVDETFGRLDVDGRIVNSEGGLIECYVPDQAARLRREAVEVVMADGDLFGAGGQRHVDLDRHAWVNAALWLDPAEPEHRLAL